MPYLIPDGLEVGIPIPTQDLSDYFYAYVSLGVLYNEGTGDFDWPQQIVELMDLNAGNPCWALMANDNSISPVPLSAGDNDVPLNGITQLTLEVGNYGPQVSKWWIPSDKGNYGVLQPYKDNWFGPMQFIDSLNCIFRWLPGQWNGVRIWMNAGCSGFCQPYQWNGVPPIQYIVLGGSWSRYQGQYPYTGLTKPFPQD